MLRIRPKLLFPPSNATSCSEWPCSSGLRPVAPALPLHLYRTKMPSDPPPCRHPLKLLGRPAHRAPPAQRMWVVHTDSSSSLIFGSSSSPTVASLTSCLTGSDSTAAPRSAVSGKRCRPFAMPRVSTNVLPLRPEENQRICNERWCLEGSEGHATIHTHTHTPSTTSTMSRPPAPPPRADVGWR